MFIIALVLSLLLPALERARHRGKTTKCWNNLRQVGLAYQMFAHDHGDHFPMEVSTNQGGTLEFSRPPATVGAEFLDAYRHFQIASNDLQSPRLLICRTDTRLPAANFAVLQNEHLSYFVSPDARYARPTSLVAGDRNLVSSGLNARSYVRIEPDATVAWTGDLHRFRGNFLLADSSVQDVGNASLRAALNAASPGPIVILPPVSAEEVGPVNPFRTAATSGAPRLRFASNPQPPPVVQSGKLPDPDSIRSEAGRENKFF